MGCKIFLYRRGNQAQVESGGLEAVAEIPSPGHPALFSSRFYSFQSQGLEFPDTVTMNLQNLPSVRHWRRKPQAGQVEPGQYVLISSTDS